MAEKYCTYNEARSIAVFGNDTPPAVPSDIQKKLITKENLTTYKCKVSNTAKINYTDKQCVLKKDIIPLSSDGSVTITLSLETFGILDGGGEYALMYVTDPGPFVVNRIDDYTSKFYPTNEFPVLFPINSVTTQIIYNPIGGSVYYIAGGVNYVNYGLGIDGSYEIYSHGTGNHIVFLDILCYVYFLDGSEHMHSKRVYPSSTTIEYQDANETVYHHVFNHIDFNNVAGPGFINCGEKQVKNIIATISIFGDA